MSKASQPSFYLEHLVTYSETLIKITKGKTFKDLEDDATIFHAAINLITILGEASNKLPDSIYKKYPDVPWHQIRGMRNMLVHQYHDIDTKLVWGVVSDKVPKLLERFQEIFEAELKEEARLKAK